MHADRHLRYRRRRAPVVAQAHVRTPFAELIGLQYAAAQHQTADSANGDERHRRLRAEQALTLSNTPAHRQTVTLRIVHIRRHRQRRHRRLIFAHAQRRARRIKSRRVVCRNHVNRRRRHGQRHRPVAQRHARTPQARLVGRQYGVAQHQIPRLHRPRRRRCKQAGRITRNRLHDHRQRVVVAVAHTGRRRQLRHRVVLVRLNRRITHSRKHRLEVPFEHLNHHPVSLFRTVAEHDRRRRPGAEFACANLTAIQHHSPAPAPRVPQAFQPHLGNRAKQLRLDVGARVQARLQHAVDVGHLAQGDLRQIYVGAAECHLVLLRSKLRRHRGRKVRRIIHRMHADRHHRHHSPKLTVEQGHTREPFAVSVGPQAAAAQHQMVSSAYRDNHRRRSRNCIQVRTLNNSIFSSQTIQIGVKRLHIIQVRPHRQRRKRKLVFAHAQRRVHRVKGRQVVHRRHVNRHFGDILRRPARRAMGQTHPCAPFAVRILRQHAAAQHQGLTRLRPEHRRRRRRRKDVAAGENLQGRTQSVAVNILHVLRHRQRRDISRRRVLVHA